MSTPPPVPDRSEKSPASSQFTHTHPLAKSWIFSSLALGLLLYAAIYGAFYLLRKQGLSTWAFTFLYERLWERGSIPHIMTIGLTVGLALLLIRIPLIAREFSTLRKWSRNLAGLERGSAKPVFSNLVSGRTVGKRPTLVENFLHQVLARASTADSGAEVDTAADQISSIERRKLDASHVPVRYLIWLIPTLGFLGTVLGISLAVSGFSEVITQQSGVADMKGNLVEICQELGIAFDTTFVALIYSSMIALLMAYVDRRELTLVNELDELYAMAVRPLLEIAGVAPASAAMAAAPAYGAGGGALVLLQQAEGASAANLHDAARQVVTESLATLALDGSAMAGALADSGTMMQLRQLIEANVVHMQRQTDWMNGSALRREDIGDLSEALRSQSGLLQGVLDRVSAQQVEMAGLMDRTREVLSRLETEGVKANVQISSNVTSA